MDGLCESDVMHRMNEECKAWRALKSVLSNTGLGINEKIFEGLIVSTAFCGAQAWGITSAKRRKEKVIEMDVFEKFSGSATNG